MSRSHRVSGWGRLVLQWERLGMSESSDRELLDLIRRGGPLTVAEMARQLAVTGTAVRNRLSRLLATGLVERKSEHGARGRPRHRYQASIEAHKRLGQNYADLALALWEEMMGSVADRKLRRLLFTRITDRLAEVYRTRVTGQEWEGRLVQLSSILHDRGVEAEVARDETSLDLILRQHSCPYYELAETDPAISLSSARCSRRSSAAVYGSVSAGSMEIGRATFRPSRSPSLRRNRVMPVRYDDRDPDDEPDPLGRWRKGRDSGILAFNFVLSQQLQAWRNHPLKCDGRITSRHSAANRQRVWFNDDVDLNRVND